MGFENAVQCLLSQKLGLNGAKVTKIRMETNFANHIIELNESSQTLTLVAVSIAKRLLILGEIKS